MSSSWPEALKVFMTEQLDAEPLAVHPVSGGSINRAARVDTPQGALFVKWHDSAPPGFFEREAAGLAMLARVGLRTPRVVGTYAAALGGLQALVLEWLETEGVRPSPEHMERGGDALALAHQHRGMPPGLAGDNWIGTLAQRNDALPGESWVEFFRRQRIHELAKGLSASTRRLLERVPFETLLTEPEGGCALLHGDLWSGNVIWHRDGAAVFVDPAVYGGHPEVDLAMTQLFGGFSARFYAAYQSVAGTFDRGIKERLEVLNLYPLIVHARLFGGAYQSQVEAIASRYAR